MALASDLAQALKFRDPITGDPVLRQVPHVKVLDTTERKARPVPETILKEIFFAVPQHIVGQLRSRSTSDFARAKSFGWSFATLISI